MNAKISVCYFVIVEAVIYLLLYDLHDRIFKKSCPGAREVVGSAQAPTPSPVHE